MCTTHKKVDADMSLFNTDGPAPDQPASKIALGEKTGGAEGICVMDGKLKVSSNHQFKLYYKI